MKNQPFIIPLIGLILGIVLYDCSSRFPNYDFTMGVAIVILPVLVFVYFFRRYLWVLFLSLFVLLGFFLSRKYNSYSPLPDELKNTEVLLNLKIKDGYRSSEKFEKYKAELNFIDSLNVLPVDVLLYWKKENPNLYHGDEVWIRSKILDLTPAKNPHQFDYSKYLERQRIHYTVFPDSFFLKTVSEKTV